MFQLHTGSYRQLEQSFLADLLAQKKNDPFAPLLVLSPSGRQLHHLQTLLLGQGEGFLNIHFLTFYALAERVLAEGPTPEGRIVSETALYREIVHDYLEGRGDVPFVSRDQLLRPGPIPKGLSGALSATLKDLQDSGARVVDCANVVREGHLGLSTEGAIPILELNVLMYKSLHDRGLRTGADRIRRAAERIPQSAWIKSQKAIYLYGFYDLTGVQLDLINALSTHPHAHVYFPYEKENPAYGYAELLLKDPALTSKLSLRGRDSDRSKPPVEGREVASSGRSDPPRNDIQVEAFSCSGTHDEIWIAAKKIIQLAESGIPYHHMAVLARTLDPYLNTIQEVFEAHHIPFALYAEEPVGAYPLIKKARQLLTAVTPAEAGAQGMDSGFRRNDDKTWSTHVAWATTLLTREMKLAYDATPLEHQLWEGLTQSIDSLAELDLLQRPVSRERFLEVLTEKLEGLRLALSSQNVPGVQVMDVMTARGVPFEAVFLVGLNEKLFPRLIREDPFLSDSARSALSSALGARLGRKMDGYQEEKLLFHLALQSAEKHLHLSCQRSDEEGKALVVSLYLHDYLAKNGLELKRLPRTWVEKIQKVPAHTLTPKEISLAFHREDLAPDALYQELGWNQELIAHLLQSQKEIESFGPLGPHDGVIGVNPLAKDFLGKGLSPATLKELVECPFKIFGRKVLALEVEQSDVEEGVFTRAGRGKIIHKILEQCYQNYSQSKHIDIDQIAGVEFKKTAAEHSELYPLAWEAEQVRILTMLKRFVPLDVQELKESGFIPQHLETSLAEEIHGIRLQGRLDRLDVRQNPLAYRVVDYKTGSTGIGKKDKTETAILKGKSFQLPIYMLLAEAFLAKGKGNKFPDGSASFYRLEEGEPTLSIDQEFWDKHGDPFLQNLRYLAKQIETGTFFIRPTDSHGYCSWCALASACRKEHKPTQIRSGNSPQRKRHEDTFNDVVGGK